MTVYEIHLWMEEPADNLKVGYPVASYVTSGVLLPLAVIRAWYAALIRRTLTKSAVGGNL